MRCVQCAGLRAKDGRQYPQGVPRRYSLTVQPACAAWYRTAHLLPCGRAPERLSPPMPRYPPCPSQCIACPLPVITACGGAARSGSAWFGLVRLRWCKASWRRSRAGARPAAWDRVLCWAFAELLPERPRELVHRGGVRGDHAHDRLRVPAQHLPRPVHPRGGSPLRQHML